MEPPFRFPCGNCGRTYSLPSALGRHSAECPHCRAEFEIVLFPALNRSQAPERGEVLLSDEESSCFFHPGKRATVFCGECGRYLCALCAIEAGERSICPDCFEKISSPESGEGQGIPGDRIRYDQIAGLLVAAGFLFPLVLPAAMYCLWKHWRQSGRNKSDRGTRFVFFLVVLALQASFWGIMIASALYFYFAHGEQAV